MYGWVGKILRVNLTNGKIEVVSTWDWVLGYIGKKSLQMWGPLIQKTA
jgi:aldehyde:ferredoxin oxidoreductase